MDSVRFDETISSIARSLAADDEYLFEELRAEMHLAILHVEDGHKNGYYIITAKNRAINYLKQRGRRLEVETISLEGMLCDSVQIDTNGNIYLPPKQK